MTFFATSLDGEGAVIKVNAMFITMQHCDRRIDGRQLGDQSLPSWADHAAHSSLTYACPGAFPLVKLETRFTVFLVSSAQNYSARMYRLFCLPKSKCFCAIAPC